MASRLRPSQVREAGRERLKDAEALISSRPNRRSIGAIYLSGLAIDCSLKACLLDRHRELQRAERADLDPERQRIWDLVYRSHDLTAMVERMPDLLYTLHASVPRRSAGLDVTLRRLCADWSIHIRYQTRSVDDETAIQFFEKAKELIPWLK